MAKKSHSTRHSGTGIPHDKKDKKQPTILTFFKPSPDEKFQPSKRVPDVKTSTAHSYFQKKKQKTANSDVVIYLSSDGEDEIEILKPTGAIFDQKPSGDFKDVNGPSSSVDIMADVKMDHVTHDDDDKTDHNKMLMITSGGESSRISPDINGILASDVSTEGEEDLETQSKNNKTSFGTSEDFMDMTSFLEVLIEENIPASQISSGPENNQSKSGGGYKDHKDQQHDAENSRNQSDGKEKSTHPADDDGSSNDYKLRNFRLMIDSVLSDSCFTHLFDDTDWIIINRFTSLSGELCNILFDYYLASSDVP